MGSRRVSRVPVVGVGAIADASAGDAGDAGVARRRSSLWRLLCIWWLLVGSEVS